MFGDPYPPGSMKGSGIYQTEMMIDVECDADLYSNVDEYQICGFKGEVEGIVNDWGVNGTWQCPTCLTDHDFDISDYQDEYYYEEGD